MAEFKVYMNCENITDSTRIENDTTIASLKIDEQREAVIVARGSADEKNYFVISYRNDNENTVFKRVGEYVEVAGYKDSDLYELMAAYVHDVEGYEFLPASFDDFI